MDNQVDVNLMLTIIGAKEVAVVQLQQAVSQLRQELATSEQQVKTLNERIVELTVPAPVKPDKA
jgi:intracellular sulfur oxidation DsrE/DsrF family protein